MAEAFLLTFTSGHAESVLKELQLPWDEPNHSQISMKQELVAIDVWFILVFFTLKLHPLGEKGLFLSPFMGIPCF